MRMWLVLGGGGIRGEARRKLDSMYERSFQEAVAAMCDSDAVACLAACVRGSVSNGWNDQTG